MYGPFTPIVAYRDTHTPLAMVKVMSPLCTVRSPWLPLDEGERVVLLYFLAAADEDIYTQVE